VSGFPAAASQTGLWESDFKLFGSPSFIEAISAISAISEPVFSSAGTRKPFSIAGGLVDPRTYTRALIICRYIVTAIYLSVGLVVYCFAGSYVGPPVLGFADFRLRGSAMVLRFLFCALVPYCCQTYVGSATSICTNTEFCRNICLPSTCLSVFPTARSTSLKTQLHTG
jgi:hypothetical protein